VKEGCSDAFLVACVLLDDLLNGGTEVRFWALRIDILYSMRSCRASKPFQPSGHENLGHLDPSTPFFSKLALSISCTGRHDIIFTTFFSYYDTIFATTSFSAPMTDY